MAEIYHFAQPNVAAPKKILMTSTDGEDKLSNFQAVAWQTSLNGVIAQKNHVEAAIISFPATTLEFNGRVQGKT